MFKFERAQLTEEWRKFGVLSSVQGW